MHEHPADQSSVEAKKIKNEIKKRCRNNDDPPDLIIGNVLSTVSSPVVARLPMIVSMLRNIQRLRQDHENPFVEPRKRQDLIIPNDFCMTKKNENLLYYDSGNSKSRFLILTTETNLKCLSECSQWADDGTFSSVPLIFKQLYTIHGLKNEKMLPLVYILLPDKTESTYTKVLSLLQNRVPTLKTAKIMLDYESGTINAFKSVFHKIQISGCLFHYSQCIWGNIQSSGLQRSYNTDSRLALNLRMLLALACVPINDVCSAFDKLVESKYYIDHDPELHNLLDYYERTWVGVLSRSEKKRIKPHFPLSLWNCYEAIVNDEIRTNNAVEGWHNCCNNKVRVTHASLSKFIDVIKNEQSKTDVLITQINTGLEVAAKRKRKYVDFDYRLKNIVSTYQPHDTLHYLHAIASILGYQHKFHSTI